MKTVTVTEGAPSLSDVLAELERDQEEVLLIQNNEKVARLIPEPREQTVLEVFGDLCGILDEAGEALARALEESRKSGAGNLAALKNLCR